MAISFTKKFTYDLASSFGSLALVEESKTLHESWLLVILEIIFLENHMWDAKVVIKIH